MTVLKEWYELIGKYRGSSMLWLHPGDPGSKCATRAWVGCLAQEQFNELRYNWSYEGKPQQGRIVFGEEPGKDLVRGIWFDTWHMQHQFMVCEGEVDKDGVLNLHGTYAAPPGPDWGWQISVQPLDMDNFKLLMYNIVPDGLPEIAPGGTKALAVEALYTRKV